MSFVLVSGSNLAKAPAYIAALEAAGFARNEIRLAPADRTAREEAEELAHRAHGLLLCGGPDVGPEHYGEAPRANANLSVMPERDRNELAILPIARDRRLPVFGVCRGLQTLNVFLGGTLFQDLRLMWPGSLLHDLSYPRDALIHRVRVIEPEHPIGRVLGREIGLVNSRHHQAIKQLAPGLRAIALAPDGLIETVVGEDPSWWIWAVQWHPENLIGLGSQLDLWRQFREAFVAFEATHPIAI